MSNNGFPADWKVAKIKDVFDIYAGGDLKKISFSKSKVNQFKYPIYSNSLAERGLYGFSKEYQYEPECLTITARGSVGRAEYRSEKFNAIIRLLVLKPKYKISCYFVAEFINTQLRFSHVGAAQNQLTIPQISNETIVFPADYKEQNKIVSILSVYDKFIENNMDRIKSLEESAERLYQEWFVKFRFPGHENVQMVDSELGPIPEGWEVKSFTESVDVLSGGTPKTSVPEYWNGNIPFFAPKDAPNSFYVLDTEKSITDLGLSKCNSPLYRPDTVFITARGTVGKVILNAKPMAMNQSCYALQGKDGMRQAFVFFLTLHSANYLRQNTGGATFDTIIVDTFEKFKVSTPPTKLAEKFADAVEPLLANIKGYNSENQQLRAARDLLLPKLISGQLDVSELDIATEEMVTA